MPQECKAGKLRLLSRLASKPCHLQPHISPSCPTANQPPALTFSKISIRPSRSMVARICSEPGEMAKGTCGAGGGTRQESRGRQKQADQHCKEAQPRQAVCPPPIPNHAAAHLGLDAGGQRLLGHRGGAHHVLVRGVGAGANQAGCRAQGRRAGRGVSRGSSAGWLMHVCVQGGGAGMHAARQQAGRAGRRKPA